MNRRSPSLAAALSLAGLVSLSAAAHAGQYERERSYQPSQDYVQVLSTRPIVREVRISEPRQECYDERVVYRDQYRNDDNDYNRSVNRADRTIGTVLGGVIGGAIGHQFGEGSGRQIATAIGAVVGADVGRNAVSDSQRNAYGGNNSNYRERVAYEPRCRTLENSRYEQQVQGYDVTYRYNGQVYTTQMPYDPGSRLPVRVDVSPLR